MNPDDYIKKPNIHVEGEPMDVDKIMKFIVPKKRIDSPKPPDRK